MPEGDTERTTTDVGTTVIETPRYYRNPITDRREKIEDLSEDGYCRRFLALHYAATRPSTVNLDSAPVATFDKEKWKLEEQDGQYVLVKREAETKFDELVLGNDHDVETGTSQDGDSR
jgi:hypothetical protein